MTRTHPPSARRPPAAPPTSPYQPAVEQLRRLDAESLDDVTRRWLARLGYRAVRRQGLLGRHVAYAAVCSHGPLACPVEVRIFQRKNRVQAHHVEAFLGALLRGGNAAGILVTTGGCARGARWAARLHGMPRVLLLDGEEWVAELARCRVAVRRRRLSRWTVEDAPVS